MVVLLANVRPADGSARDVNFERSQSLNRGLLPSLVHEVDMVPRQSRRRHREYRDDEVKWFLKYRSGSSQILSAH